MNSRVSRRSFVRGAAGFAALATAACAAKDEDASTTTDPTAEDAASEGDAHVVGELLANLSIEQKIAQLIMPAIRTWNGEGNNVAELSAVPDLAAALRSHQYCGVILFGQNVSDAAQTTRLVSDLQANNAKSEDATSTTVIPYFVAADQEGGSVARLSMGTRGTGSMAIGATGENAVQNARDTGTIFGLELSALGINVNLGPCADVIMDLADQGMATRVFSNDPQIVQELSRSFAEGVAKSNVVTCFKHFPGIGDGSDDPTAEHVSLDELRETGLVSFSALVDGGADMIMTSAVTFPDLDESHVLADGTTEGYYPATMSPMIVGQMLREELGYDGVVMTDALEMEQFVTEPDTGAQILPGEPHGVESHVNIAQKCIEAGCDILLIPQDLCDAESARFYEEYIAGLAALVKDGAISESRVDESVRRILALKERYGVFDVDTTGDSLSDAIAVAEERVGSQEHHGIERDIAEQAVTLLKGSDVVPIPGKDVHVVILGRTSSDDMPISYALEELMESEVLDPAAYVEDRIAGSTTGSEGAYTSVYIDRYYDMETGELTFSADTSAAIEKADYVVCLAATRAGLASLQDADARMQGIARALEETHAAGAKFVLLSNNIPVEGARFPEADAVVCSYLSSGYDVDPTTGSGAKNMRAINANTPAALRAIFGAAPMPGTLPIDVYAMAQDDEGQWVYTDEILFPRGTGA